MLRAGHSFRTYVVFGIADNVFAVLDSGKARTPNDAFFVAGVKSPEVVSAAVRWLMMYDVGKPASRASYSNQEMFNFYLDRKKIDKKLLEEAVTQAKKASRLIPRGALAAHLYLFEKSHPPTVRKFTLDLDKNCNGARKLINMLARAAKNKQNLLLDNWRNAVLVQVWNAYRAGRPVTAKDLRWSS